MYFQLVEDLKVLGPFKFCGKVFYENFVLAGVPNKTAFLKNEFESLS